VSRIEIITIGDELIEGRLVDTNAGLMSARLADEGLTVVSHLSVGDDLERIADALRSAAGRSDAVLVSGGLGPTSDDLTAAAAAHAFELPIERAPEALAHVEAFFRDRGRRMSKNNEKQADLPQGCTLLPNPGGTAVGFRVRAGDCRLYFMPGVPRELEQMFSESVLPDLETYLTGEAPLVGTLKVFGKGESDVAQMLEGLDADPSTGVGIVVQYRATFPEIHVRLVAAGPQPAAKAELDRLTREASRRLGKYLFAAGGPRVETTFADAVAERARRAGVTVAVADGCTGGVLSSLLSRTEPGPDVFAGAVVAPVPDALPGLLELEGDHIKTVRMVELAADAVRRRLSASTGVAVVGTPRTGDGTEGGKLVAAVATDSGTSSRELGFPIDADRFRRLAAYVSLALLGQALTE
jgi:nicotinamide-nucleotide amidase